MSLNQIFNGASDLTLIYRGDCTKRGLGGSAVFKKGQRFDLPIDDGLAYTFVAEKVTVKPINQLTEEEFAKHINGNAITPLVATDAGTLSRNELCTVVEFKTETAEAIPSYIKYHPM